MTTVSIDRLSRGGGLLVRNPGFARVLAGASVSMLGTAVAAVSLPIVAVVLGASPLAVGVLEASVWAPWLLVGLPAGAWADRYSPRRLIVTADVISAMVYGAVPILAAFGALHVWYLVLLALVAGSSEVISQAAFGVLPPMLVGDRQLESGNAALQGAESTADFFGAPGSSLLTRLFGVTGGLAGNAVSFLVSALCVGLTPRAARARPPAETAQPLRGQIVAGVRALFGHRLLRRLALTGAVVNTALTGTAVLHALFLIRAIGVAPAVVGLLLVGQGAAGIVGAALAPRIAARLGTARAIAVLAALTFPFALLTPLAAPGWRLGIFVVGTAVPILGIVAANVLVRTLRQRTVEPALLGRVSAGSRMLAYSTSPVAALLSGALAVGIGLRASYLVFAVLLVVPAVDLLVRPLTRSVDTAPVG